MLFIPISVITVKTRTQKLLLLLLFGFSSFISCWAIKVFFTLTGSVGVSPHAPLRFNCGTSGQHFEHRGDVLLPMITMRQDYRSLAK
uniref:Putative secreted peptide n=1 Tax=Anopheles braziliensis TaxID=58242 RepID=A0A2M3ZTJ4_9DIPT